jgi:transposase-like protein
MDGMLEWQNRPLDPVYPVLFIDCIHVKIRDGNVANRPIYVVMGVTVDGTRDILGLWAGEHGDGEGAKYWLRVLSELKNRGVQDVLIVVCDGLKYLPDSIGQVWPQTIVQTCVVHLLRNTYAYASRKDWAEIAKDLKPVYTAPSDQAALDRFAEFSEKWKKRYPAIIRLWTNTWAENAAVLAVRPRDKAGHLHDQRDRVGQRPNSQGREGPRPFPDGGRGPEMRVPGHHEPRPHRHRPPALVQPMEGSTECLRDHL